jgi:hypothetical protein|eukprot:COSAG01_NODE_1828_length_9126_cov_53.025479_6_plen_49_part_00
MAQNAARLRALLCYGLNSQDLHKLPTALAGSVATQLLGERYEEIAVVR